MNEKLIDLFFIAVGFNQRSINNLIQALAKPCFSTYFDFSEPCNLYPQNVMYIT